MSRLFHGVMLALTAIGIGPSAVGLALDVPTLTGRIVDLAGVVPPDLETSLSADLAEHERKTGNQIAVLTLPSLEGEPLEDFSHRVATTWRLGQQGRDNGVLLLVVPGERRIRIEVGYGLEGRLTDAAASRIIRHVMVPRFKAGDLPGGIRDGLRAIMGAIEGIEPPDRPLRDTDVGGRGDVLVIAAILGAFIGMILGRALKGLGTALGGALSFFLGLPSGWGFAVAAAAIGMVTALLFAMLWTGTRRGRRSWDTGWGPGWGGGYGGGFPSSSDSFSGGGGDFGGGGASGRW